jgi:hypothetical protein
MSVTNCFGPRNNDDDDRDQSVRTTTRPDGRRRRTPAARNCQRYQIAAWQTITIGRLRLCCSRTTKRSTTEPEPMPGIALGGRCLSVRDQFRQMPQRPKGTEDQRRSDSVEATASAGNGPPRPPRNPTMIMVDRKKSATARPLCRRRSCAPAPAARANIAVRAAIVLA